MCIFRKMKRCSLLYFRLNSTLTYSKVNRTSSLVRSCDGRNLKLLRCQSTVGRSFEGPGLADFMVKDTAASNEGSLNVEDERVPYLNELDYNGKGRKVHFIVHGCQMNVNDIEIVWSILQKNGYERATKEIEADVVLIMTCSIRESAEDKIIEHLSRLRGFKKNFPKRQLKVGVLGCMAERLKDKLLEKQKGVDLVAGPDSYKDLPRLLALTRDNQKAVNVLLSLDETYADVMPVKMNENDPTAYISIMRGCDNMCTYCIVPFTRGRERSRPVQSILDEVKMLSEKGIKQVTLLGQNVNSYRDTSVSDAVNQPSKLVAGFKTVYKTKTKGLQFDVLLDRVSQIDPNMRIRFTAPHPKDFPDEVLYLIRDRKNICCCLHLPAQSGSNAVLERMRRGHTREAYLDLVDHIRSIVPNVCFTTDIIVGFCGETEEDHEDTLDLIRRVKYSFVYHYPYSMREKTTAHRRYVDDVPEEVKRRRSAEVNAVFRSVSLEARKHFMNQTQLILIDGVSKKKTRLNKHGRNDGNCSVFVPDCEVPVGPNSTVTRPMAVGDYVAVQITEVNAQSMQAKPLYITSLVDFDENKVTSFSSRALPPLESRTPTAVVQQVAH